MNKINPVAASILGASIIIAGAILLVSSPEKSIDKDTQEVSVEVDIPPISSDDHILGNPDAPIVFVEYSDIECPFCKNFHGTMHRIIDEYGPSGKVAWVYRQFPIDALHKNARTEALATECAAEQGGNDMFWKYIDKLFTLTKSSDGLDISRLPNIAVEFGLDKDAFNECLESKRYNDKINEHISQVQDIPGIGTPYTILMTKDGYTAIEGAQPYETIKPFLDNLIANLEKADSSN